MRQQGKTLRARFLRELVEAGFEIKVSPTYGTLVRSPGPSRALLGHVLDDGRWRPIRIPLAFQPLTEILDRLGVSS